MFKGTESARALSIALILLIPLGVMAQEPAPPNAQVHLSPLPSLDELQQAAKGMPMTLSKCEATAEAFAETPTAEVIKSLSDERVHQLNVQAFACMRLGGQAVRYGYALKTSVDVAYWIHGIDDSLQRQHEATVHVTTDMLNEIIKQNNGVVDKYNDLVDKYNSLLSSSRSLAWYAHDLQKTNERMYVIARNALWLRNIRPPQ
jgi:hypothetical protein